MAGLYGLAAGAIVGGACAGAGGASLGTLIGSLAILAAVVPQASPQRVGDKITTALTMTLGVTLAWLIFTGIDAATCLRAGLVLATWTLLLTAATRRGTLRPAVVTILAWAWLAWPVWLGPSLAGPNVPTWATGLHPIFAVNAAALELGVWTQQPVAYQITPLGQDLAYALPATIWTCTIAQTLAAAAFLLLRRLRRRRSAG